MPTTSITLEQSFATAPHGIGMLDRRGRWLRINPALERLLGRPASALIGQPFAEVLAAAHVATAIEQAQRASGEFAEICWLGANGDETWSLTSFAGTAPLAPAALADERPVLVHVVDITTQKDDQQQLRRLAEHDELTGLWNRPRLRRELDTVTAECQRTGERAALLLLDFDGFKYVNYAFGHYAGDDLLAQVVGRVQDILRPGDSIGRLGGDEFAVLLRSVSPGEAAGLAQQICDAVADTTIDVDGVPLTTTVSIGLRPIDGNDESSSTALVDADIAMSDAKQRGAGRVVTHVDTQGHHERIRAGLMWSQRIRRALKTGRGFVLFAQPVVDLATGEPIEHELLLRMIDDDGTLVPPATFLAVAEQFRLIRDIDQWVIGEATRLAARYPQRVIAVNLSASSLLDPALARRIEQHIRDAGCQPAQLVFEITETEAIDSIEKARIFAGRLSRLGCRLALDDFGSGFASFYHLKALPLEFIKLDGEFVRNLPHSREDQLVVTAVQGVVSGMDRTLIAEHIEDQETADLLRQLGVRYGQGYHFARPAPVDAVLASTAGISSYRA